MTGATSGLVLGLTCNLDARRERVFAMLTEPVELAKWWGPRGFSTPEIALDLRVGGRYRFWMQPPGGEVFHLSGVFLAIEPPRRLAYTFRWDEPAPDDRETTAILSLDVKGEGTNLTLSHGSFATEERLALHRDGWTDSFERLREVLEAEPAERPGRPARETPGPGP